MLNSKQIWALALIQFAIGFGTAKVLSTKPVQGNVAYSYNETYPGIPDEPQFFFEKRQFASLRDCNDWVQIEIQGRTAEPYQIIYGFCQ